MRHTVFAAASAISLFAASQASAVDVSYQLTGDVSYRAEGAGISPSAIFDTSVTKFSGTLVLNSGALPIFTHDNTIAGAGYANQTAAYDFVSLTMRVGSRSWTFRGGPSGVGVNRNLLTVLDGTASGRITPSDGIGILIYSRQPYEAPPRRFGPSGRSIPNGHYKVCQADLKWASDLSAFSGVMLPTLSIFDKLPATAGDIVICNPGNSTATEHVAGAMTLSNIRIKNIVLAQPVTSTQHAQ